MKLISTMKRLLMITYYFPPLGMSGVLRPVKFAKYLPRFGWEPIILTVKDIAYYATDEELLKEVDGLKVFRSESLDFARILYILGKRRFTLSKNTEILGRYTFNFFFIPDARLPWVPFALSTASKVIKSYHPDAVYTVSPPFTAHLIGLLIKEMYKIPWVADFTDHWATGHRTPSPIHYRINRWFRNLFATKCDLPVKVYQSIPLGSRAVIIEHGYDDEEFSNTEPLNLERDDNEYLVVYTGVLQDKGEGVWNFLRALKSVEKIRLVIAGEAGEGVREFIQKEDLSDRVDFLGYIPHRNIPSLLKSADALWFVFPYEDASMKLYEYLGAGKVILFQAPPWSEATRIARSVEGIVFLPNSTEKIVKVLRELREIGNQNIKPPITFSRVYQAQVLARYLDSIIRTKDGR